ncbi:hypothetical protein Aasi_0345 [Candidatus Amoebophilus asiaticus 5a2]|uniref:Uncharacterized protein n=1 Tax=Amoebophilus asiaticus (strain 5a2) TaxID=452471 RepID=B3ERC0_AMOA5|nr:hypothetical protein Aasi_0345 [Candidatus Amoebophilus asiaticus 5a2]
MGLYNLNFSQKKEKLEKLTKEKRDWFESFQKETCQGFCAVIESLKA